MESVSTRSQKVNCALQFQESNLKNFLQPTFFFVSREAYQVWLWAMPHRQRFEPSGAQHNLSEFTCDSARKKTTNAPEKNLPSGYVKIAIENGPVEIVSFPIKNGDFPCLPGLLSPGVEVVIERDPGLEVVKLASTAVARRQGSRSNTMGNIHGTIIMGIYV